jgi:hypothetical protein
VEAGQRGERVADEAEKEEEECCPLDFKSHIVLIIHADVRSYGIRGQYG